MRHAPLTRGTAQTPAFSGTVLLRLSLSARSPAPLVLDPSRPVALLALPVHRRTSWNPVPHPSHSATEPSQVPL